MNLVRSSWKKTSSVTKHEDYILVEPEQNVIVSFTSMLREDARHVVWGCWYREVGNKVVYTALKKSNEWRRESYDIRDRRLVWNNGEAGGSAIWLSINETEIPEELRERAVAFLAQHADHVSPPFESNQCRAEQAVPPKSDRAGG